ncbi:BTB/POZ protein [Rhizophagus irregularis DAOM 181602=DAOM 197198]|nr:BTB/POZ protein [Rhizophagus irregularis DAOM 181602=DAOM 197198]
MLQCYMDLQQLYKKNDGTLFHIKLQNILPEIFQIILRYIYSGRITLEDYDTSDIIKILVAGMKGSKEILGGYNPIEWKSDNSYGRVKDEQHATYNHCDYGPSFGDGDLDLLGDHCSCDSLSWTYEYYIGGTIEKFLVEEYEVYQINNS